MKFSRPIDSGLLKRSSWFPQALLSGVVCPLLIGCSFGLSNDLQDQIEDGISDLADIKICDGMTLEELQNSVTISEGCKAKLEAYLPQAENNFEARLIVLATTENADGSLSLYLEGVDSDGDAAVAADWDSLQVSATVSGNLQVLTSDSYVVSGSSSFADDVLSVGFVNDYSASMSVSDISVTAEIEQDILSVLSAGVEGEVTLFSTEVSVKQTFVDDVDVLSAAVAYDDTVERDVTALYDGMGVQLTSLVSRSRPVKLLVVATDGQENSSMTYEKAQLIETIKSEGVCVLILGSLFSDPKELKEFSGSCGAYFYTPGYADLKSAVGAYVDALGGMVRVDIPESARGEGEISLSWEGITESVSLP